MTGTSDPSRFRVSPAGMLAVLVSLVGAVALVGSALLTLHGVWPRSGWLVAGVTVGSMLATGLVVVLIVRGTVRLGGSSASRRRATHRADAERTGWTWADAAPPPAPELCEAVFRQWGIAPIRPLGMSEVLTRTLPDGRRVTAGHLVGYAEHQGSLVQVGNRIEENVVVVELPGLLPELRFVDLTADPTLDLGASLPWIGPMPGQSARWRLEGFDPTLAAQVVTGEMLAVLETAPAGCTVAFRAGHALASRDPSGDLPSVEARLDLLQRLVTSVPETCWNVTDARGAGAGVFPATVPSTHRLSQADRRPAGHSGSVGLDWHRTPDAPAVRRLTDEPDVTAAVGAELGPGFEDADVQVVSQTRHVRMRGGIGRVRSTKGQEPW